MTQGAILIISLPWPTSSRPSRRKPGHTACSLDRGDVPIPVTLRRHHLTVEIYHLEEPQRLPLTMSPDAAE